MWVNLNLILDQLKDPLLKGICVSIFIRIHPDIRHKGTFLTLSRQLHQYWSGTLFAKKKGTTPNCFCNFNI